MPMDPEVVMLRALLLEQYGNHLSAQQLAILEDLAQKMAGSVPNGNWWRQHREQKILGILRRWKPDVNGAYAEINRLFGQELPKLAGLYRKAAAADVGRELPVTPVRESIEIQGAGTKDWTEQQKLKTMFQAEAQLRVGANLGETNEQLAERVATVVRRREREMETLTRTAATRAAAEGYELGMRAAGVRRYRYVAILDERTTELCKSLDGNIYDLDDPTAPRPPMHWNCRSHIEPLDDDTTQRPTRVIPQGASKEDIASAVREDFAQALQALTPERQARIFGENAARRLARGMTPANVVRAETGQVTLGILGRKL